MKTWTPEETRILTENYDKVTNSVLRSLLPQKSRLAIYKKAYKMGLRVSKETEAKNRSECRKREKSANWNGGIRITSNGYRQVLMPNHPRADSSGYVMEHIVVFEKATGIAVPKNCCIHHLNGKKTDNAIENLCLMAFDGHTKYHNANKFKEKGTPMHA